MTLEGVKQEISDASRILAANGILDAFGHVSRRYPEQSDRFLISRSLAPAQVTAADILTLDFDGEPIEAAGARLFLERFLHGEIYRIRPDVQAIVHSHAPAVLPFTVVPTVRARPICHMCGFLYGIPATFDVADHAGEGSDLLIRSSELGKALANHIGQAAVVLMRGHGYTAVGASIEQVTYRAIYTSKNCEIQSAALSLGNPVYISAAEAVACERAANSQVDRAWNLWKNDLAHT